MNYLPKSQPLTKDYLLKYIELDKPNLSRLNHLYEYYVGKHSITTRSMADTTKPNNRLVNSYAHYITDISTGYFMGEPVKYNSADEELLSEIKAIYDYNDESANNAELATDASIFGIAYEQMYLDEDKNIRFKRITPIGCIPIYDNTIESELLYFIRYYPVVNVLTNKVTTNIEVYSQTDISYYVLDNTLTLTDTIPHNWGLVPINVYRNNENELGDFETVISLIDAYDKLETDAINEMEYTADCYLVLKGMMGTDSDDIVDMKNNRVMLLPEDGEATWLSKNLSDTYVSNLKENLDKNIHKFSYTPAMTDEDFASNASGVAMKYKLMGLENATSKKERCFKVGLQRRIEQIVNLLAIMGTNYDYRAITITFTRNIPVNIVEMADVVNKIGSLYSVQTQMSMLPIEVDYDTEMELKAKEQTIGYSDYEYQEE